jgi:PIN domain nuclease of toxin-antitoxin system
LKLLVDTHLILWAANEPERLSAKAWKLIHDPNNTLLFSSASIWEVAIKFRRRGAFSVDPLDLRDQLLAHSYVELAITSDHAIATASLPLLHHDPFDRLLLAQATVEKITLITGDSKLVQYRGRVTRV